MPKTKKPKTPFQLLIEDKLNSYANREQIPLLEYSPEAGYPEVIYATKTEIKKLGYFNDEKWCWYEIFYKKDVNIIEEYKNSFKEVNDVLLKIKNILQIDKKETNAT